MNQDVFKSGRWIGFYLYRSSDHKHRMDLTLNFANGRIEGDGNDDLGAFVIQGSCECETGECHWTKSYVGQHDVFYRGYRENKSIWGTWEIHDMRGGFRIWPKRFGDSDGETESEVIEQPVEAIGELVSV